MDRTIDSYKDFMDFTKFHVFLKNYPIALKKSPLTYIQHAEKVPYLLIYALKVTNCRVKPAQSLAQPINEINRGIQIGWCE